MLADSAAAQEGRGTVGGSGQAGASLPTSSVYAQRGMEAFYLHALPLSLRRKACDRNAGRRGGVQRRGCGISQMLRLRLPRSAVHLEAHRKRGTGLSRSSLARQC